jgi:hypothetical protein
MLLLAASAGSRPSAAAEIDYHSAKAPADLASAPAFPSDWLRAAGSAVDVSFLLDAPAGRHGRIGLKDGHLATGDGRRFRIWGINATGPAGLPAKENAPRIAEALARHGINAVRFHFLDRPAPRGLIAANRDDTRELDPVQLERLDWFIAELKRCGIYSDLNLNVARAYKPGDGVKDHELLGFAKAVTFFDPRLLELQREYARQLLTHRNPHTGATYATEPAVALVEFVNENSLIEAWKDGRLRGAGTRKNPGTWSDIPASYAADLTNRYNGWLRETQSPTALARWRREAGLGPDAPLPRLLPDQFASADRERFHAEASFYLEVERDFYRGMAKFLREDIGVKALLLGNSDHGHSRTGYPQLAGTSLLDVVDGHVYWQHPKYITDPQTGRQTGFTIGNTPMVDAPLFSTVVELSRSAFAGKPYTVSEVNHPFPHEYACEGIPLLAAYGAFQDWDGIFWYTLAHQDVAATEPKNGGHFDLATDPVKMAQLPVGALLFLRGDVAPARQTIARTYTREQVREGLRLPYQARPYFTPGFPSDLPLRHASRIASLDGPATGTFVAEAPSPLRSDTGELLWQAGAKRTGLVTVDTARTQALVGFIGQYRAQLKNIAATAETPFCALTVSSLDAGTIGRAERLLVTATARVANSGMAWNAQRDSLVNWGVAPTRIEAVRATLRLGGIEGARAISIVALNSAGAPAGTAASAIRDQDQWLVPLDAPATSYLLTVQR